MKFDPENIVFKSCGEGIALEGENKLAEAAQAYSNAWKNAVTDFEKFTAAHYMARVQPNILEKLKWDELALDFVLKVNEEGIQGSYSSLYLNIGKCYEDLGKPEEALKNYNIATSFIDFLKDDGYGKLIKNGIAAGIDRISSIKRDRLQS